MTNHIEMSPSEIRKTYNSLTHKEICDLIIDSDWMTFDNEDNDHTITCSVEQYNFFAYLYEREMYEYALNYACQNNWEMYLLCNYDEVYSNF